MIDKTLKESNQSIATFLAFAIIPISGLATDIYLPSMPDMAADLGLPETKIQLTLALFLVSYGVGQFFAGAIVDTFGRYKVSVISLFLFVLSFWWTANTDSIYLIYLMRITQGILSALIAVAKRAYFIDVYKGEKQQNYLSALTITWSLAPIVAPFISGYLQNNFGWASNFYFLAIYCAIILVFDATFGGETLKDKKPFNIQFLYKDVSSMLRQADFIYGLCLCGFSYAAVMFYNLSGPFIIEHTFGKSSITIGYISLLMGLAWMAGSFLSRTLLKKPLLPKINFANTTQIVLIILMFASSYYISNLYSLVAFAFLIHFTAGFIFNNFFLYCLSRFPKSAGVSSGLTGGMSYVITSLVSYSVVALINPLSQEFVAIGYFIISILAFIVLRLLKTKQATT